MNIPRIAFYTLGIVLISIAAVNLIRATVELAKIGEWGAVLLQLRHLHTLRWGHTSSFQAAIKNVKSAMIIAAHERKPSHQRRRYCSISPRPHSVRRYAE